MAYDSEQLQGFMDSIGSDPASNFKMLLYYADLDDNFASDEAWGDVCEFAAAFDAEHGISDEFTLRYMELFQQKGFDDATGAMLYDLRDNKIFAALGLHKHGIAKNLPFIAASAFNKSQYQGLKDEFAVVRFLVWSGYDINAPDGEQGMTALHYFASINQAPGTHPRAVRWLLEHGADVNAVNANGDTALTRLCGNQVWNSAYTKTFEALLAGRSNPFHESSDGKTPYSLLCELNEAHPHEERTKLINTLEAFLAVVGEDLDEDEPDGVELESGHDTHPATLQEVAPKVEPVQKQGVSNPEPVPESNINSKPAAMPRKTPVGFFGRLFHRTPESMAEYEKYLAKQYEEKLAKFALQEESKKSSG